MKIEDILASLSNLVSLRVENVTCGFDDLPSRQDNNPMLYQKYVESTTLLGLDPKQTLVFISYPLTSRTSFLDVFLTILPGIFLNWNLDI